ALAEPLRAIAANAGYNPDEVLAQIRQAGAGHGFDVTSGQVVEPGQAGIYDSATVQKAAVHAAISSAALALTIEVLVHHKKPEQMVAPPTANGRKRL
ncbi:MAG: hypothetical protein HYR94_13990, partial [Chloroflexi bacterium]|nr:hypothetical protein [Chloroflexota bacterium]